jgi:hypothetical protein
LRTAAEINVWLVPAFELSSIRVSHSVTLNIGYDLLEERSPLQPITVVTREWEVVSCGLIGTPEIGDFEGKDSVAGSIVRMAKVSVICGLTVVLALPDTFPCGDRCAESIIIVGHVDGITTWRLASLGATSCLVVDLQIVHVKLGRRIRIDTEAIEDSLSEELRRPGASVERDAGRVSRSFQEVGRIGG